MVEVVARGPQTEPNVSYYEVDLATQDAHSAGAVEHPRDWETAPRGAPVTTHPASSSVSVPQHAYGAVPLFGRDVTAGVDD